MNSIPGLNRNISFEDFILSQRESIKKKYFTKIYKTVDSTNGQQLIEKTVLIDDELKKWHGVISTYFSKFKIDRDVRDLISLYCELCFMYKNINNLGYKDANVGTELYNLYKKMIPNKRSKIIDRYYNYETGTSEYLLEDGTYVPILENLGTPELKISQDMLPKEILSLIDIQEYRNQKIDKIL